LLSRTVKSSIARARWSGTRNLAASSHTACMLSLACCARSRRSSCPASPTSMVWLIALGSTYALSSRGHSTDSAYCTPVALVRQPAASSSSRRSSDRAAPAPPCLPSPTSRARYSRAERATRSPHTCPCKTLPTFAESGGHLSVPAPAGTAATRQTVVELLPRLPAPASLPHRGGSSSWSSRCVTPSRRRTGDHVAAALSAGPSRPGPGWGAAPPAVLL
jgi:hypothetical protein